MADSAMVTESNLAEIGDRIAFITRLPATYHECERDIREAVGTNAWETLGPLAQSTPTKNRPLAIYRAHESTVTLYDKRYRAVVIHSSSHDKRRNKKLDRDIQSSEKVLLQQAKERAKPVYACRADADAAAKAAGQEKTRYHRLEVSVQKHLQYAKGRPKKGTASHTHRRPLPINTSRCRKHQSYRNRTTGRGLFRHADQYPRRWKTGL